MTFLAWAARAPPSPAHGSALPLAVSQAPSSPGPCSLCPKVQLPTPSAWDQADHSLRVAESWSSLAAP